VDKDPVAADFSFLEEFASNQLLQVNRRGLSLRDARLHQALDAAIRLQEYRIDQLTAVDLGQLLLYGMRRMLDEFSERCDLLVGPSRSLRRCAYVDAIDRSRPICRFFVILSTYQSDRNHWQTNRKPTSSRPAGRRPGQIDLANCSGEVAASSCDVLNETKY